MSDVETEFNEVIKPLKRLWWKEPREDLPRALFALMEAFDSEQNHRTLANLHHLRTYGNAEIAGFAPALYASTYSSNPELSIAFNLVESVVQTVMSRLVRNKPRPWYVTDEGNFDQQERAKARAKLVSGEFYRSKVHTDEAPDCAEDACVFGTGAMLVGERESRAAAERVFIDELRVDDYDGRNRKPRNLYRVRTIPREDLEYEYRESRRAMGLIKDAKAVDRGARNMSIPCDELEVVEAWHLPPARDADGGRYVKVLRKGYLVDEPWTEPRFPFSFLRFEKRRYGFYGRGISEIISGIQEEANELLWKIQEILRGSGPHIFVRPGANVSEAQLSNLVWSIIEADEKPELVMFAGIDPALFTQLRQLKDEAYAEIGVSQMSARGEKPAGLDSGKALRTADDIEAGRFTKFLDEYQSFHLDVADLLTWKAGEIKKRDGSYSVLAPSDGGGAELVDWSDAELPEDGYITQAFPVSFLSTTPQARLEDIEDLLKIFPEMRPYAQELLDFPDLRAMTRLSTADLEIARKMIGRIVSKGERQEVDPAMNLALTMRLAQQTYLLCKMQGLSEDRLTMLLDFIAACRDALKLQQQQAAPTPGTPTPQGPAQPMAPPPGVAGALGPTQPGGAPGPGAPPSPMTAGMAPAAA